MHTNNFQLFYIRLILGELYPKSNDSVSSICFEFNRRFIIALCANYWIIIAISFCNKNKVHQNMACCIYMLNWN